MISKSLPLKFGILLGFIEIIFLWAIFGFGWGDNPTTPLALIAGVAFVGTYIYKIRQELALQKTTLSIGKYAVYTTLPFLYSYVIATPIFYLMTRITDGSVKALDVTIMLIIFIGTFGLIVPYVLGLFIGTFFWYKNRKTT